MKHARLFKRALMAGTTTLLCLAAIAPLAAAPDLDVVYISRTPRYDKYNVTYTENIDPNDLGTAKSSLSAEEQAKQRWPKKGEVVTFTAVVKNPGDAPTGEFSYKWYFDGKEVGAGTLPSIEPGGKTSTSYKWTWDSEWNNHNIKFVADPDNKIKENVEVNNIVDNRTNALCYRFHVWPEVYTWFMTEGRKINPDIATFEDWCQLQMREMNRIFSEAVYPISPNGILERVRVDEVVLEEEGATDFAPGSNHTPLNMQWDGGWGFAADPYIEIFSKNPDFVKGCYTWGLHEHSHQMGMIDLYQLNIELDGSNKIQPTIGHTNSMTGCVMVTSGSTHYSEDTANAFNSNLHKRRGYFGDYMYDLPKTCKIRLLDAYYKPLANTTIKFYQDKGREIAEPPTFIGTTDAKGIFTMPNRSCFGSFTTGTGHTLHDNPWGLINVVGLNGIFFCEINKSNQKDYQYLEILPFNMAYARGNKDTYTYDLQTSIVPGGRVTAEDLNAVKMVSKTSGYTVGNSGTILQWNGKKWSKAASQTTRNLRAVDANSKIACVVGDNGTVLVNSGKGWTASKVGTVQNLRACAVINPTTIIVGGEAGRLYRSTDSGANWTEIDTTTSTIRGITFSGQNNGLMICDNGKTYLTVDGGATWTAGTDAGGRHLTGCSMASASELWACNEVSEVYHSTDGGKSWNMFALYDHASPTYCMDMENGGNGWVLGRYHQYYGVTVVRHIGDYKTFIEPVMTYGDNGAFYGVSNINNKEAWAVGKGGVVLHLVASRE